MPLNFLYDQKDQMSIKNNIFRSQRESKMLILRKKRMREKWKKLATFNPTNLLIISDLLGNAKRKKRRRKIEYLLIITEHIWKNWNLESDKVYSILRRENLIEMTIWNRK
jgi:hypothetical protein